MMKRLLFFPLFLSASIFPTNIKSPSIKPLYDKNSLIVEYRFKDFDLIKSAFKEVKILKNLSTHSNRVFAVLKTNDLKSSLKELKSNPLVKSVSLNYIRKPLVNDPLFENQWYLPSIEVERVWEYGIGDKDIVVAVFDTGISLVHEDLRDNIFVNEEELRGEVGVDDDNNGYIDDVYGYDFAYDLEGSNAPLGGDIDSHGTHVSGIIGAVGDNGIGISGVNLRVSILPIKVFRPNLGAYDSDILEAIDYVLSMKKRVNIVAINASYGGFGGDADNSPMKDAIETLGEAGVAFFAAAGNSGVNNDMLYYDMPALPASYNVDTLVAVAAVDEDKNLTYFSQYGKKTVETAAPGINILSTVDFIFSDIDKNIFFDGFEDGLDNWSLNGDWGLSTEAYEGSYSLSDSVNGNYKDTTSTAYSKTFDLSGYKENIALRFCIKTDLASGDSFLVTFYDKNSDSYNVVYHISGKNDWNCIGIPIENYYKTDSFKIGFVLSTNADGNVADGVYIDNVTIGDFNKTDGYQSWAGTSMATPIVSGVYALLSSLKSEDLISKISRIIGNSDKVDLPIKGGVVNAYKAFIGDVPPFIFGTKKVLSVGSEGSFRVAGGVDEVLVGGESVGFSKDGDSVTFDVPSNAKREVIVRYKDINSSNKLYISKWRLLGKMPNFHSLGGVVGIYDDKVYVAGGYDFVNSKYSGIDVFDLKTGTWENVRDEVGKVFNAGEVIGSKIYLIDREVEVYDIKTDTLYKTSATLDKDILFLSSIRVDDNILLLGGEYSDGNLSNEVYLYDTLNDTFKKLSNMNEKRLRPAVCEFDGKIYIFGGDIEKGSAEVYDIKTNTFKEFPFDKKLVGSECLNVNNEYILIFGGIDVNQIPNYDVYKFYPKTMTYEILEDSVYSNFFERISAAGTHKVVYNNKLYYFGGYIPYIYGTKTYEVLDLDEFTQKKTSSKSASLFDFIFLVLLLGGVGLILRRR